MPRVTQKGQVMIPAPVRKHLGIQTGDEIVFEVRKDDAIIRKKKPTSEAFEKYIGFLSHLKREESNVIVDTIRGKADDFSH